MNDWDERYRRGEHASLEPSSVLLRALEAFGEDEADSPDFARMRALDLACGAGRHALALAACGFGEVLAVDSSRAGIELTKRRAGARGLLPRIAARVTDLTGGEFRIEPSAFDLICDFYYLQRDLFPHIRAGVRPGGLFAAAIHLVDERPEVRPMNPDFLLRPEELRSEFRGWEILHYHETTGRDEDSGEHHRRTAELIARRRGRAPGRV